MSILKEFTPRTKEIDTLKSILELPSLSFQQRKNIELEIHKIQLGDQAEKNASFYLKKRFQDRDDWIILNNLRFEIDGDVAQIDHLGFNRFGVVYLFETKNFSTGLKITDKGDFFRWDSRKKQYIEIPSPIQQSKFHEQTLRKVFAELNFEPHHIAHFILVDYKAKLIKPDQGFEHVCRPDRIEDAVREHKELGVLALSKVMYKLAKDALTGKEFTAGHMRLLGQKMIQMHKPIEINYFKKFGIESTSLESHNSQIENKNTNAQPNTDYEKLTLNRFAQKQNLSKEELENHLVKCGYFERIDELLYLTEKGKLQNIEFRKGRYGPYFLIPNNFILEGTK